MKKLILILIGGVLLNAFVFAQVGSTTQRGKATREMNATGFCAEHGSFPLGSTIKVRNTITGVEIDVTVTGRIRLSPERVVDLSLDAWNALKLTEDTVVMLVYSPPPVSRPNTVAEEPEEIAGDPGPLEIWEKVTVERGYANEMSRLKPTQTLYHLLLVDRRHCAPNSDIGEVQRVNLYYKFLHGKNGYLVAVYSSSREGPVFPVMPNNARILVDMVTTDIAFIRDYVNSAAFRRFITNRQVVSQLQKALR